MPLSEITALVVRSHGACLPNDWWNANWKTVENGKCYRLQTDFGCTPKIDGKAFVLWQPFLNRINARWPIIKGKAHLSDYIQNIQLTEDSRFPEQPGHFSRSNELPPITNHNNRPPLPFPLSESSLPPLYYPGPPPTSYQLPAPPVATSLPPVSAVKQEVNGNVFGGHSSITSINFPTAAQQQPHDDPNFSQSFPTGGRPPFRYADYSPPSSSQPLLADPFATRSIDEYSQTRAGTRSTSPPRRRGEGMTPRAYLDSTVVPTLLDGLKLVATER